MAVRALHFEVGGEVRRNCLQHQHGAALIFLAQQGGQLRSRTRKVKIVEVHALFKRGIKFEEADHLRTAGAEINFALIMEVGFQKIQLIVVHMLRFLVLIY